MTSAGGRAARSGETNGHTPVMQQYLRAKDDYPDAILFFRLGDFYEMFFEDALAVSELLGLALTARGKGPDGEPIPMAGVPHHAAAGYIAELLRKGRVVAVCEQMADPRSVRGVVPREVVRVITPGLCVEPESLDARAPNYLVAVDKGGAEGVAIAALELSTLELRVFTVPDSASALAETVRLGPREILLSSRLDELHGPFELALDAACLRRVEAPRVVDEAVVAALGPQEAASLLDQVAGDAHGAVAICLRYAARTRPGTTLNPPRLLAYDPQDHLSLDEVSVRNLELVRTLSGERRGSLLEWADQTRSPMGARLLRRRVLSPAIAVESIRRRHDRVQSFVEQRALRDSVREYLGRVGDLQRLTARAVLDVATPKDLGAIRDGLAAVLEIGRILNQARTQLVDEPLAFAPPPADCSELRAMLETALVDEPPATVNQGGIIRERISAELDELRTLASSSREVIVELERRERERTGIGSLKVKFTKVFGYYIEVTRPNLPLVPDDYRRKQTVANAERFVTEELDALQERILQADERSRELEEQLFADLRRRVAASEQVLLAVADWVAEIDVHAGFATLAHRHRLVRPTVDESFELEVREGRHPIVESICPPGTFVPNDLCVDAAERRLAIITGPNMAGKSTVMRQLALIVILAQAGSFVPADAARIGVVDRIFTRVGASDDLSRGQSTFMVEMTETAMILRRATRRSFVIVDEIGRGTSTYDGLAIAWAVAEHMHDAIGCRTLFATHYHEICELAELREGVFNLNVAAREHGEDVVFLHKLVAGAANRSYGVAVAKLAGLPPIVLARARALLRELEERRSHASLSASQTGGQLDLFASAPLEVLPSEVEATLAELEVERMTPIDALVALARLKSMLDGKS